VNNVASHYLEISAAIKDILETVEGIGKVLSTHRYTRQPESFREFFTSLVPSGSAQVNAWLISRVRVPIETKGLPIREMRWRHQFVINGYTSLRDADGSEAAFQQLVDRVIDALLPHKRLNVPDYVEYANEPQCTQINHDWFGPVLCHHCVISLEVLQRDRVEWVD